jgi:hypothetical protein
VPPVGKNGIEGRGSSVAKFLTGPLLGPTEGKTDLADHSGCRYSFASLRYAPVAQLDRAFDYESKGRTFESCRAHLLILKALRFQNPSFSGFGGRIWSQNREFSRNLWVFAGSHIDQLRVTFLHLLRYPVGVVA